MSYYQYLPELVRARPAAERREECRVSSVVDTVIAEDLRRFSLLDFCGMAMSMNMVLGEFQMLKSSLSVNPLLSLPSLAHRFDIILQLPTTMPFSKLTSQSLVIFNSHIIYLETHKAFESRILSLLGFPSVPALGRPSIPYPFGQWILYLFPRSSL